MKNRKYKLGPIKEKIWADRAISSIDYPGGGCMLILLALPILLPIAIIKRVFNL